MTDVEKEPGTPSSRVVEQRVRNRVIDYLELAASFVAQEEYAHAAPTVNVPYEVINQWEDWVPRDPRQDSTISDVYTPDEVEALGRFHAVWDVAADAIPDDYPSVAQVQAIPEWEQLRRAAESALAIFVERGRLPEDHEAK